MNVTSFNQPQKQSASGIVIMFADSFQQYIRALWPILIVWVFKMDQVNKVYLALGIVLFFLVLGVIAYLKYVNFTFFIDDEKEEFVINSGIINKTKTVIQLQKIQQININQNIIQRIIGVYALDIDSAGSDNKEAKIKAVNHQLAIALKSRLLENESTISETEAATFDNIKEESKQDDASSFLKIQLSSLFKVGITSNYSRTLALLMAFFFTIYENAKQYLSAQLNIENQVDNYIEKSFNFKLAIVGIVLLFIVVIIINLGRTIFNYFDFKIVKQKGSLLLSYGLINTKSTILKPEKVQIVTISQNFFQQKLDVLNVKVRQATSGQSEKEINKSIIEIPGCNSQEQMQIIQLLLSKIPKNDTFLKSNFRKLIFPFLILILLPILLIGFSSINFIKNSNYLKGLLPFWVIIVALFLIVGFKNYKLFISNDGIVKQSGVWDIDQEILETHKIQAITVKQKMWHNKPNIGTLILHTAGGSISFRLANFTQVKKYVNIWLYEIETSNKNWM